MDKDSKFICTRSEDIVIVPWAEFKCLPVIRHRRLPGVVVIESVVQYWFKVIHIQIEERIIRKSS